MLGSQKCVYILRFSLLSNQSLWVGKCCGWEFVHFLSDEKFSTFPKRRRRQQWRLSCTCFLRLPLVWKGAKYLFNICLMSTLYSFCFFWFPLVRKGAKYLFNIFLMSTLYLFCFFWFPLVWKGTKRWFLRLTQHQNLIINQIRRDDLLMLKY